MTARASDLVRLIIRCALRLWHATAWLAAHGLLLTALAVPLAAAGWYLSERLTRKVLAHRVRYTLTPSRSFDPSREEIWRTAAGLLRAGRSGPWWAPARS